jgi:hypothetical protein
MIDDFNISDIQILTITRVSYKFAMSCALTQYRCYFILKKGKTMNQNIDKNSSDRQIFTLSNLGDSLEDKKLHSDDITQKNSELQQAQARYLTRFLEAYGDCV